MGTEVGTHRRIGPGRRGWAWPLGIVAVVALVAAACGGSGSGAPSTSPSSTAPTPTSCGDRHLDRRIGGPRPQPGLRDRGHGRHHHPRSEPGWPPAGRSGPPAHRLQPHVADSPRSQHAREPVDSCRSRRASPTWTPPPTRTRSSSSTLREAFRRAPASSGTSRTSPCWGAARFPPVPPTMWPTSRVSSTPSSSGTASTSTGSTPPASPVGPAWPASWDVTPRACSPPSPRSAASACPHRAHRPDRCRWWHSTAPPTRWTPITATDRGTGRTAFRWLRSAGPRTTGVRRRPRVTQPDGGVRLTSYGKCSGGSTVELYTITGEGHEWPGGPKLPPSLVRALGPQSTAVDANAVMWAFFVAHPLG